MTNSRYKLLRLLIPLIVFLLGCPAPTPPPEQQSTTGITLLGQTSWVAPGSRNTFLVQVRAPYGGQVEKNRKVNVALVDPEGNQQSIFAGKTDDNGIARVKFNAPEANQIRNPQQTIQVTAETQYGIQTLQQKIYLGKVYNVLISSDKPIYQPGQTIHLRTLALDSNNLKAAQGVTQTVTVADPEGNKLMRKEITTSDYGIASADFVLDSQAASGDYIITAEMGPNSSSRSVEVKPYVLPRFKVEYNSQQSYYRPGDLVTGTVTANYFFGKPVSAGKVTIKGFATDVERHEVLSVESVTDDQGVANHEFTVPDYFIGQLDNDSAKLDLEISVIDTANHEEKIDDDITVAEQPILVDLVGEAGELRNKLENNIYVHVHYPDGADAASAQLRIKPDKQQVLTLTTDLYGLATFTMTPSQFTEQSFKLEVTDQSGITATQKVVLDVIGGEDALLLRPDKAEYRIGDTLNVDIVVRGQSRTVYLDVIKGRQTFALVPLPVKNGKASAAINLDGSLLGTLELNAYLIDESGTIKNDRRYVLVNPAPAQIDVKANADQYRPGDTATLDIQLQNNGQPMQGAVGVSIVDESVFSLGAQEPGFARTYFLLNRQLLEPRYEIQGFDDFGSKDSSPYDNTPSSIQTAESGRRQVAGGEGTVASVEERARQIALAGFFATELSTHSEGQATKESSTNPQSAIRNSQFILGWTTRALLALPLIGLAFYDGSRKRRYLLIGLLVLSVTGGIISACAAPAAAPSGAAAPASAPADASITAAEAAPATGGAIGAPEPPRLRQFFPETLFWLPEQETDANGHVTLDVPIADSITTWRISVIASDKEGNLGSAQAPLKVFQDFFVEPDFPRFLTAGDELSVPVSVYNYLAEKQTVKLSVEKADWFEFVQEPELDFEIGANEVAAAYIPIRVTGFGQHEFKISATGSHMSDAVLKSVEVVPDGKHMLDTRNGKLQAEQSFTIAAPQAAVPGSSRLTIKLYPGVVSQVVDGLEGMLQEPNGCFEQTSSTTYPNVLVLDYLKATNQSNPRLQMTAERYINLGYQRLLSFEVDNYPGGFSLFGDPPPQLMLTAYGLMEFSDMAKVSYVDPNLLDRAANFIMNQQAADGSWSPTGMTIESGLEQMGSDHLLPTAYILWALSDAGFGQSDQAQQAVNYIKQQLARGELQNKLDPYALALLTNALLAVDAQDQLAISLLDQLVTKAQENSDGYFSWESGVTTYMGGYGDVSNVETSAMMILAALRANQHIDAAQKAIDGLIARRNGNGYYYSTQTTVLVLKALLAAAQEGGDGKSATVTVTLNGGKKQTVQIDDSNGDVVQTLSFDNLDAADNQLQITVQGDRAVQYQLLTDYYLPWSVLQEESSQQAVKVDVQYDRTEMKINDRVGVTATVELQTEKDAGTLMVTLGVPPGFLPVLEDFDVMVAQDQIDRYDFTLRQVNVYLTNVAPGQPLTLHYHLTARYPVKAQTPASGAYDYYSPGQNGDDAPQRIVVTLGTADE